MSRKINKKKSTTKYRKFKISPLIPVIAIIEVIILVAISSYAWFVVVQEKEAKTGIITVDADSGLDIDFKNANYEDEINIWDYVDEDFSFEPVTSLDGRNVFVPTSGTFGETGTNSMVFRDATINDINDKYLNVDFMLTNTTSADMDVYLGNESRFKVWNGNSQDNSRALRLAFYTNDGEHGKVDSSILANTNNENAILEQSSNTWTVYFKNTKKWSNVYAYVWRTESGVNKYAVSWPGSKMTRIAGDIYSYTFNNPADAAYQKIIFNDGTTGGTVGTNQTADLTLTGNNSKLFNMDGTTEAYTTKTCYFFKPSAWSGVKAHAFVATNDDRSLTTYPGDDCVDCGAGIYSYTFPTSTKINGTSVNLNKIIFSNSANSSTKTADLNAVDGKLYFKNSPASGTYDDYTENTLYFYNSQNFAKPYAKVTGSGQTVELAMTNLSAGVFYVTAPAVYTSVVFEDGMGATQNTKYTQSSTAYDGYIYKPNVKTSSGWTVSNYSYSSYVGTSGQNPYAVISPGVSAGFQRAYTPVVDIASTNGAATQLIPAFASSIDNYIKGSGNPLFTIPAGGMKDLSMIIWLEGTDTDCTVANYAMKNIELYLEFSTTNVYRDSDNVPSYTYRFYDKTRECWTSDRLTNAAGISIAPVMQLYDATTNRGYLMHAASTTSVGGVKKIDLWECTAPSTLFTGTDNMVNDVATPHDIYFRRVDPYDEDEVWNYWHPGSPVADAGSTVNGKQYVSFTAFADGAPASSSQDAGGVAGNDQYVQAATTASTPAKSCGGLWGTYETTLFTAVDGTDQFRLANSGGVLTMHYTYKYSSGATHEIEYKASGPMNGQFYYFVIPKNLLNNSNVKDYRFNRYWDFNSEYAMNIYHRNSSMAAHVNDIFTMGSSQMSGYYAMLTRNPGGNAAANNYTYFGQDLMYINISYKDEGNNNNLFNGDQYKFKVHYWNTSNNQNVDQYFYTNNGNFQINNYLGYVTVVPAYAGTTKFNLVRCNTNSSWSQVGQNKTADVSFTTSKHNFVAYKWNGDAITYSYNNDVQSTWPTVPSYE